jgi:site-specific DNA-methyltransferase (adenine-specific)
MKPYYKQDGIVIYHGDCRDVLPVIDAVESIVSDPPYGMRWDGRVTRGSEKGSTSRKGTITGGFGQTIAADDRPFDPSHLLSYDEVLLWGMNHFPDALSKGTALVWIKRHDSAFGSFLSDAEIAWLNRGCGVYCRRDVSMQAESAHRLHPAQKPEAVMSWCLGFVRGSVICDPYMGSGTTLVAAKRLGRKAIGIELEEKYCEIAAQRLSQGALDLFGEASA